MYRRILTLALLPLFVAAAAIDQQPFGASSVSERVEIIDCGSPTDAVLLRSVQVSPDPPQPGQNVTITVTGDVQSPIDSGAYADVTVKVGLIKLLQKRFDVCEEAAKANASIQCPVSPDTYTVVETVELPKDIPPAKFSVAVRGYTAEEADMLCLDLKLNFLPGKKSLWPLGSGR